ncbi:MAG: DUF2157 domain-containing protein [Nitrospinaceae bacterium]
MEHPPNREQAQQRIDRIHAFQREMATLKSEGILEISQEDQDSISQYHSLLIDDFSNRFDTDSSVIEKKLSWGMRILTFLGGLALCASVFFFFYRFWGLIPTSVQIVILIIAPLLALLGMKFTARKEKTLYYATLAGLLAFLCFVMNLNVLGTIFNITPSPKAFLVWGIMALLVAYHLGLRLLLMAGLLCILGYLSATVGTFWGIYWLSFGERPENFIIAGAIMVALPHIFKHRQFYNFPWFYHLVGLLSIFIALLVMGHCGRCSYSLMENDTLEIIYQTLGLVCAGIAIWMGIRFHYTGVTNIGATFFTIFLYTKFFDWWWDFLPKYMFFFILSVISLGLLSGFKKMRSRLKEVGA